MELRITTTVAGNYRQILDQFTEPLFLDLAPVFPKFRLVKFEGSMPGNEVEIELSLFGFPVTWASKITERHITVNEAWFTDEGRKLPWPLKKWKHRHLVTRLSENKSRITDQIYFSTGFGLADLLIYPVMYAQFAARKPVYRRWFGTF